ncbi:hypothetical protein [Enterococcus sp. DIV1297f]|uniref:hypothetical protein n=1 Tax=Enterococcus sp. DIV1297f TaxID=2774691 RepID=UPI003D283729
MEEIRFSNQNMQKYYNEIMHMETSELNLIIAEKKVALGRNKNLLNVVMICYISFLILGLPQAVFPEMFSGDWGIISYSILTLIAIGLGTSLYDVFVSKHVEEYEVLIYLKEEKTSN